MTDRDDQYSRQREIEFTHTDLPTKERIEAKKAIAFGWVGLVVAPLLGMTGILSWGNVGVGLVIALVALIFGKIQLWATK